MDRKSVLRQLKDNLERARAWRDQASADFDAAIQAAPLVPDHHGRLELASKEYTQSLEAVDAALAEYQDYVILKKEPCSIAPIAGKKPDK